MTMHAWWHLNKKSVQTLQGARPLNKGNFAGDLMIETLKVPFSMPYSPECPFLTHKPARVVHDPPPKHPHQLGTTWCSLYFEQHSLLFRMLLGNNALLTPSAHLCSLVLTCAHLCSLVLTCACLCSFENSLCLRSPFGCSSRLSLFPSVPNCGAMPSKALRPSGWEGQHWTAVAECMSAKSVGPGLRS